MRILCKYPTRSRPQQFIETLGLYTSLLDRPDLCEVVVTVDDDDRTMRESSLSVLEVFSACQVRDTVVRFNVWSGPNKSKIQAINADMDRPKHYPWDIVLLVSDDMIPQVQGYDTIIREAMAQHYPDTAGGLWFFDGRQDRINTIQCMGRKEYERLGYIYHPSYKSLWCDNEATDVGLRDGTLTYIDRCIIKNMSPDWTREPGHVKPDALYVRNNRYYRMDEKNYERRKAQNFPK